MTRANREQIQASRDYSSYATSHIKTIENINKSGEEVEAVMEAQKQSGNVSVGG